MRVFLFSMLLLILAGCALTPQKPEAEHLSMVPVSFDDLDGWSNDHQSESLAAFRHSCPALTKSAWKTVCAQAAQVGNDDVAARRFFEAYFQAYAASGKDGEHGLFTGYYVPELRGSLQQGGAFQTPLYARPGDLITADLGAFKSDLKGQHIVGKIFGTKFIPYDDRATIAQGSLAGRAAPLVWIDDPVGAFFLEVQGSGRIRLTDGSLLPVGYDGANGHAYVAIGKILADRGDLPRPVTMPAIKSWLAVHPAQAQQVMNINPSYVFFRRLPNEDVLGAQGVALTPRRSMAVDPGFVTLGTPVWLETADGTGRALRRLMIAQDTGGAIKGAVRGDFFWGADDEAATQAGAMQSDGRYFILLPKNMRPDDER